MKDKIEKLYLDYLNSGEISGKKKENYSEEEIDQYGAILKFASSLFKKGE